MKLIQPFAALRPQSEYIAGVIAPPYDVLNTTEAKQQAANKPWSFLHISKPEIDLPAGMDPYSDTVYQKAASNFSEMIAQQILQQDAAPYYYVYRLTSGAQQQTGLVALAATAAYEQHKIKRHEQTQPAKVNDRMQQIAALQAQTGPVLLVYPEQREVDKILMVVTEQENAVYDVMAGDAVRHQLWLIKDANIVAQLTAAMNDISALYIADGHHRAEAAVSLAKQPKHPQYFLTVIFPHHELKILSYHRVVKDLNGLTAADFLNRLKENFIVEKSLAAVLPTQKQQFGIYLREGQQGQWYLVKLQTPINTEDKRNVLDVSLLARFILEPILNITDPRRDPHIEFIGGSRGLKELERRVDNGDMAIAFSLFPTAIEDVMSIADAGEFMPPKSTWFEPKLADGMVSYWFAKDFV